MNTQTTDHTGAYAEAFYIANLLFVGIFYIALWGLYLLRYQDASAVSKHHLRQALVASSISTTIFILINIGILLSSGYASLPALISLEVYFMLVAPVFLVFGILAFIKAITDQDFTYPLIGRFVAN